MEEVKTQCHVPVSGIYLIRIYVYLTGERSEGGIFSHSLSNVSRVLCCCYSNSFERGLL